jgi:hypothetical protein
VSWHTLIEVWFGIKLAFHTDWLCSVRITLFSAAFYFASLFFLRTPLPTAGVDRAVLCLTGC